MLSNYFLNWFGLLCKTIDLPGLPDIVIYIYNCKGYEYACITIQGLACHAIVCAPTMGKGKY